MSTTLRDRSPLSIPAYPEVARRKEHTAASSTAGLPSVWSLGYASLLLSAALAWVLVAYYAWFITPYVCLPADILMWAETNFVGDLIKLRVGAPIYTPPADNNSLIYTPGPVLLTYAISWLLHLPPSIAAWRTIQLAFVAGAALLGTACWRILYGLAYPAARLPFPKTWAALMCGALSLAATAPHVNSYVHCLHADALALLVSVGCFLSVLLYLRRPNGKYLLLMAACPAVGYLAKQFLISWSVIMALLLFLDNPKDRKRLVLFGAATACFIGLAVGGCFLLWGDAFRFWTFEIMGGARRQISFRPGGFNMSVPRMVDHLVRAWLEISLGIVGVWLVLHGPAGRRLWPLGVAWLALIASEAFSSGAGWSVLYHFGPGVLLGVIWLFVALPQVWPTFRSAPDSAYPRVDYLARCLVAVAGVATVFLVLRVVPTADTTAARSWHRRPSPDAYRYIADIEREFAGLSPDSVLLDVGNWVYLPHAVLMKDRAISTGDQPVAGIYDNLEVMRQRICAGTYAKVLVHDFHASWFLYDWADWPRPSGIRQALLDHYDEVRTIPGVEGNPLLLPGIWHSGPVSVLVRKPNVPVP